MAGSRQSRQSPSSLAFSRQPFAAFLEASLRSGCDCLRPSCSLCSSGVLLTLGGETFLGGLGFGSDADLGFVGFGSRRLSPGFSRIGVDEGLSAGSYLLSNLLGSGMRRAKVAPTARFCGGTSTGAPARSGGTGLSPRVRGNRYTDEAGTLPVRSIPACAGEPR